MRVARCSARLSVRLKKPNIEKELVENEEE